MSRKVPKQDLPHFGVKNKLTRHGSTVISESGEKTQYKSVGQAKRFMRTGEKGSSPCAYKPSSASRYITRRAAAAQKMAAIRVNLSRFVQVF